MINVAQKVILMFSPRLANAASRTRLIKNYFSILIFLTAFKGAAAQLPVFEWAKGFEEHNEYNPSLYSNGRSIAVDQLGNVYSAGLFDYTVDFDPGPAVFTLTADNWANRAIYIAKLSPKGDFLWAIQIPTYVEFGNIEISVDKNNDVYIASELRIPTDFDPGSGVYSLSPIGGKDAFVAKYKFDGSLIWAKQFGGPGDTGPASDVLVIDSDNNVIVGGIFNNTVDFDPGPAVYNITSTAHMQAFIVKLNSAGEFIWARQFGNSSVVYSGSNIADVKCDLLNNIYLTGDFSGNCDFDPGPGTYLLQGKSLTSGYITKLDSNGNLIWARSIEGTSSLNNYHTKNMGLDVDAFHNVYIAGSFNGPFDFDPGPNENIISSKSYDFYILKLNAQGDFVWVDIFAGSESETGTDVAVGNDGTVYALGIIGHEADMDPGPGQHFVTINNQYDAAVLIKLNAEGNLLDVATFDQIGSEYGSCLPRRMVVDIQQNIYITGFISGTIDFDPGPDAFPLSTGQQMPYVLKLSKCKGATTSSLSISTCKSFTLNNEIFDATGTYIRIIKNSTGCDSIITLDLIINKKYTEQTKIICQGEYFFAGGANQTISGTYRDTLISSSNCDSIVTTYLTVNPSPEPMLGPDRDLCGGTYSTISPGSFKQYLWQDMSTSETLTINNPGQYWVKVSNEFNCVATDSVIIKSILPVPDNFLKKTDSICTNQKLLIASTGQYNRYLWSNGAIEKETTFYAPGTYWLEVTNAMGCVARDSIYLYGKDCLEGVYIPTAFSPNNDGVNDIFKAAVFGNVRAFKLQIFTRDGQLVFQSTDPSKGWNGAYNNVSFSSSTLVWQCFYQFENRSPEYQKGTVTIIR